MSTYELLQGCEPNTLKVCEHCLWAIESREGNQRSITIYVDADNIEESKCDWCGDIGFDVLYEI